MVKYSVLTIYSDFFMPVTRSAKKAMRQANARRELNKGTYTKVKTFVKKVVVMSKTDAAGAEKLLPQAYKVIDTASKKNIIHRKNADHKKSLLARAVAAGKEKGKK